MPHTGTLKCIGFLMRNSSIVSLLLAISICAGSLRAGQGHTFTGYFTTFIATGISGGAGGTDFGVHVVTLTQ